jgi:hypothetical protein
VAPCLWVIDAWLLRQSIGVIFGSQNVEEDFLTFQNETTACFEKSWANYPVMRHHIPEERMFRKTKNSQFKVFIFYVYVYYIVVTNRFGKLYHCKVLYFCHYYTFHL